MAAEHSMPRAKLRIGFVSTRLGTTDGVSLEAEKWTTVLNRLGHQCFFFAGLCDRPPEVSYVVPEAHFTHPSIVHTNNVAYNSPTRPPELTRQIQELAQYLKQHLYTFTAKYDINMLIVENALAIPLNIPLGIAITEFIA